MQNAKRKTVEISADGFEKGIENRVIPRSVATRNPYPMENGSFDSPSTSLKVAQDDNCFTVVLWVSEKIIVNCPLSIVN